MSQSSGVRYETAKAKAEGRGSAKSGTHHFFMQRVTAFVNLFMVPAFAILMVCLAGRPYEEVKAIVGFPLIAGSLILMIWSIAYHIKLGLQVVIEDYIHRPLHNIILQIFVMIFSLKIALFGTLGVLMVVFG